MATKNYDELHELCIDWVRWCETRRFYMKPPSQGILARLQPSKAGKEPNARNHADMQYFNMAIHTLADMPDHKQTWAAFKLHYLGPKQVVKRTAAELGIGRQTYYDHIKRFAKAALSMSHSLKRAHEANFTPATTLAPASPTNALQGAPRAKAL